MSRWRREKGPVLSDFRATVWSMTRRVWFARDCWLTADPKVEQLADLHGPAGVLALEEVLALAKLANEKGRVMLLFSQLAKRAYLKSAKDAKAILSACVDLGLVDLQNMDERGCTLVVPRYARWQVTDPKAAARQAKARESHDNGAGKVTALHRDKDVTPS